jgi:hypothetical protein
MGDPRQSLPAEQAAADGPGAGGDQPVSRLAWDPMAKPAHRKKRRTAQPEVVMRSVSTSTVAVIAGTEAAAIRCQEVSAL